MYFRSTTFQLDPYLRRVFYTIAKGEHVSYSKLFYRAIGDPSYIPSKIFSNLVLSDGPVPDRFHIEIKPELDKKIELIRKRYPDYEKVSYDRLLSYYMYGIIEVY